MKNEKVIPILTIFAVLIVFIIFLLIFILLAISMKEKREKSKIKDNNENNNAKEQNGNLQVKKSPSIYTPESIINFMEFEKIEDNMIIQKNGKFLMVIECQGINYDLMSEMERVSVEQGFLSFLNTLRTPIQFYIQTRTVNLEKSIEKYRVKFEEIEKKYDTLQFEYEAMLRKGDVSRDKIDIAKYELLKQKNLKDYTEDIIKDVERQSLNQGILSKKYYVVVHCYQSELVTGDYNKDEIRNMAFSELYTRARSVINSLYACQVVGKVLNSDELVELLYMAYNRDDADLLSLDKMKQYGMAELYSTAPDVLDKKEKAIDNAIEQESINLANEKISEVRREREQELLEKEYMMDETIKNKAKDLIKKHKKYVGEDIAQSAIEKIENASDKKQKINKAKTRKKE